MTTDADELMVSGRAMLDHWDRLEGSLGKLPVLEGGYTREMFALDLSTLEAAMGSTTSGGNEVERTGADRDQRKAAGLVRFDQVKAAIKAQFKNTKHFAALPQKPTLSRTRQTFMKPFEDLAELWLTLNNDTSLPASMRPMTVAGGYTQADFAADVAALTAAYEAAEYATRELRQRRAERTQPLAGLKRRLTQYRNLVKSQLNPGDPLLNTLP